MKKAWLAALQFAEIKCVLWMQYLYGGYLEKAPMHFHFPTNFQLSLLDRDLATCQHGYRYQSDRKQDYCILIGGAKRYCYKESECKQ